MLRSDAVGDRSPGYYIDRLQQAEVIPEVRPDPSPSCIDIQAMINSMLERQAKSTDELLHRLVKERDGKKLDTTSINHSSSTCIVSFTQTKSHISGASMGGKLRPT
jgi:ssRNA-specific RNase YbeY (16S rRNA maturation enzyme)